MPKRAIVMAGGKAVRLRPLSLSVNKHMLPVYTHPMIHWVIKTLTNGGITDILVLLNHRHAQPIMELLEDGDDYNCSITYGYQREVVGLTKHIQAGRSFVENKEFVLMLGTASTQRL